MNLVPFKSITDLTGYTFSSGHGTWHWIINVPGNVIAFVPIPFIFQLIYPRQVSFWPGLLLTLLLPALIELAQYIFQTGSCDIDDWILNVTGIVGGMMIITIRQKRRIKSIKMVSGKSK